MFLCCPQHCRRSYSLNNYSNSNRHECFWTSGHLYFKCPLAQKLSCRLYMVVYKNLMEQEMAMEVSPLHKIKCRCTGCEYAADDSGFCFFCEDGMCSCTCAGCLQVYKILIFIGPIPSLPLEVYTHITHLQISALHRLFFDIIYKHGHFIYKLTIGEFFLSFLQTQLNFHRSLILDHWIVV